MADSKITALTALTAADPVNDMLPIVDVSDTTMAASGTTKKISVNNILGASGTATLASATITGDLTVATSVLKVDTANTRVGINTTSINGGPFNVKISPSIDAKFVIQDGFTTGNVRIAAVDNAYNTYKVMDYSALSHAWYNSGSTAMTLNSTGLGVGGVPSGVNRFTVFNGATQALTLDTSGNLLVGTTTALASGSTFQNLGTSRQVLTLKGDTFGSYTAGIWNASTTNDGLFVYFGTEATLTVRGGISYNRGGGLVAYNTTSDYRAKDIIGPVSNSGSLIDSLKVYVGKMKGATIERPMLIAHEAQEVAPYAVTGTKDEVDADGNPKYQQMDVSALVPVLIAEIQSLRARVQTLEAK